MVGDWFAEQSVVERTNVRKHQTFGDREPDVRTPDSRPCAAPAPSRVRTSNRLADGLKVTSATSLRVPQVYVPGPMGRKV